MENLRGKSRKMPSKCVSKKKSFLKKLKNFNKKSIRETIISVPDKIYEDEDTPASISNIINDHNSTK